MRYVHRVSCVGPVARLISRETLRKPSASPSAASLPSCATWSRCARGRAPCVRATSAVPRARWPPPAVAVPSGPRPRTRAHAPVFERIH